LQNAHHGPLYLLPIMSVASIIEEIQNLSSDDQAKIIKFVSVLDAKRRLSGSELNSLASYMADSADPVEQMIAREAIMHGFYGDKTGA
jgi:hypothetical protein